MTDEEMADYLGFEKDEPKRIAAVQHLTPEKRATFERMAEVEIELKLWQDGLLGPPPKGVLIDTERSTRRRRAWR